MNTLNIATIQATATLMAVMSRQINKNWKPIDANDISNDISNDVLAINAKQIASKIKDLTPKDLQEMKDIAMCVDQLNVMTADFNQHLHTEALHTSQLFMLYIFNQLHNNCFGLNNYQNN